MLIFKNKKEKIIFKEVCDAILEILNEERDIKIVLTPKTRVFSLGMNSMKFINLFLKLEHKLNIDLDLLVNKINLQKVETIQDLVKQLK